MTPSSPMMEPRSPAVLADANIWLNVLTNAAYAQAKAANTSKVRVSSYRDFAKFVSTTHKGLDPEHSNIVIHTDGTIATVYFDFVFKIDGKDENRGSETWQLVKATPAGRSRRSRIRRIQPCSNSDWDSGVHDTLGGSL